jgi:hypothetical protein
LARNIRAIDRDVRTRNVARAKFPEVGYRLIEDVLQIPAKLIIALRECRPREEKKKQDIKEVDNCFGHSTVEKAWRSKRCRGKGGIVPTLKACPDASNVVNWIC